MTKEENLHWLNQEIRTWENECQSKHPIKEALYAARKALEQEPTLEKDGTLIVTTEHYENVGRVLVQCGTNGTLFYQDQDPIKPMVEIDLYSVIKQKYIEREVLDEIRAEIEEQVLESLSDGGDDWFTAEKVNECLDIIDKYRTESEGEEMNKQELIEALNQADIMLRPAAIVVNRKTAEIIRNEIPDFEKYTCLMTNEWLEDWQAVLIDRKKFNELANKVVDVANALTEVFEDVRKF